MAACRVVPVVANVPVFPAGTYSAGTQLYVRRVMLFSSFCGAGEVTSPVGVHKTFQIQCQKEYQMLGTIFVSFSCFRVSFFRRSREGVHPTYNPNPLSILPQARAKPRPQRRHAV